MIKWLTILIISTQFFLSGYAQVETEPEAYIIFDSFSLEKSRIIDAAIVIRLEKGWHIYWRNPGDSGMPTSFEFTFPESIKVSEIKWAVPETFEYEGYASYGYEGLAVFPFSIYIPENFSQDKIAIEVNIKSLICKDVCKPFNQKTSRIIQLKDTYIASKSDSDLIYHTYKALPIKNDKLNLRVENHSDYVAINFSSGNIKVNKVKNLHFIPYENGIFKNSFSQNFSLSDSTFVLNVEFDPFKTRVPEILSGILVIELISEEGNSRFAFEVNQKIE